MSENTAVRKRLAPADRERMIIDVAIEYFAEVGLSGDTRELAKRIGITQPLLYRYFPTKEDLIEEVFNEVYLARVQPDWANLIIDRDIPLRDRLIDFAHKYTKITFQEKWIRIYAHAGLKDAKLNQRYIKTVTEPFLKKICGELRHHIDPEASHGRVNATELNLVWIWHGGLYYWAIRKYIYHAKNLGSLTDLINHSVDGLIGSFESYYKSSKK